MNIRAKLICESVSDPYGNGDQKVVLRAVPSTGSEENASFSKWTPSASVEMMITNPLAKGFFEPGKAYYVDFSPAP